MLLLSSLTGAVPASSPPEEAATPPGVPLGIPGASTDWWTAVQEDIRQSEYHATW